MIDRRQSTLLWFGLAAPPLAWTIELVFGYGVDDAACSRASMTWGIDDHLWHWLYAPVARGTERLARLAGLIQQGRISVYLTFSFCTLLALLYFVQ